MTRDKIYDVIIIGGGQSALACGYFLEREKLDYVILDDQPKSGGAWQHAWDSLTLFSPSEYSSLPGWMMPKSEGKFPSRKEVIAYLIAYELRYKINVIRPVYVTEVKRLPDHFKVNTINGDYYSKAIISATGTWGKPFIPDIQGKDLFQGEQIHSAHYRNAEEFRGKKVLIVGSGNSGAQVLAEVSKVAITKWAVQTEPEYLPDEVDGRVLFDVASAKYHAMQSGTTFDAGQYSLGKIVMVPPVVEARERDALKFKPSFKSIDEEGVVWPDGNHEKFDAIIWCTGFRSATDHLRPLNILDLNGKALTNETKVEAVHGLFLVGYGNWTGFASATLIGVGRSARKTVQLISEYLKSNTLNN